MAYDLLLKNARLVDPRSGVDGPRDVAIEGGRVAAIGVDLDPRTAERTWDLAGKIVIPGLVDNHMHSTLGPGGHAAYAMLARAGVTTATDFAGPPGRVIEQMIRHGSGINVASLQVLRPTPPGMENMFSSGPATDFVERSPTRQRIGAAIDLGLREGAIGAKLLGGHYPFDPDATLRVVEEANARRCYVAFHVGTSATGSNLNGLIEAVGMATPTRRVHLCHISSALRGQVLPSRYDETARAMALLEGAADSTISESFLTRWSPDPGLCIDGVPDSAIVRTSLAMGGYEPTEAGLIRAIDEGYTVVLIPRGDDNLYETGPRARAFWQSTDTTASIAFPISFADSGLVCATHKRLDGQFTVTALASDAGQFPLNVTINHGLNLVDFGAIALSELIHKACDAPARMLGLETKGHLAVDADADIAVIDPERKKVAHTLVAGELVMTEGYVLGRGGTFLTTEVGAPALAARGLPHQIVDVSRGLLYRRAAAPVGATG